MYRGSETESWHFEKEFLQTLKSLVRSLAPFYPWILGTWGKTTWGNHTYYHSVEEGTWRVDMLRKTPCGVVRSFVRCWGDTRPTASAPCLDKNIPRQRFSIFLPEVKQVWQKVERERSFRQRKEISFQLCGRY